MSRVRLDVLLDEPDRAYAPGEMVAGRVEVTVGEDCSCRELTVGARWRTFGEANHVEGERSPILLGEGEWRAGQVLSFPFSLPVPWGPPSYEGTRFSLAWTVQAV